MPRPKSASKEIASKTTKKVTKAKEIEAPQETKENATNVQVSPVAEKKIEKGLKRKVREEDKEETHEVAHMDPPVSKQRKTDVPKVKESDAKVAELEEKLKSLQKRFDELKNIRQTEPEKLLKESLRTFQSHEESSSRLIQRLKGENTKLKGKVGADVLRSDSDVAMLEFFKGLSGLQVEYMENFQQETSTMVRKFFFYSEKDFCSFLYFQNRRFSSATLERTTKPFKCKIESQDETRSISFLIWLEKDEIEYRPLSLNLHPGEAVPSFMEEEIVMEQDQGPIFLSRLLTQVHCPEQCE